MLRHHTHRSPRVHVRPYACRDQMQYMQCLHSIPRAIVALLLVSSASHCLAGTHSLFFYFVRFAPFSYLLRFETRYHSLA